MKFPVRVTLYTYIQFVGKIWRLFKVCQLLRLFRYSDKYMNRSISVMKLTGKSRPTRRKTCPSTTTAIINRTRKDLGSNPGLCGDRTVTIYKRNGTALDLVSVISGATRN